MIFVLSGLLLARPCVAAGPPPVITLQPVSQAVLAGDSVTFEVQASSSTSLTYQWRTNGVNIPGATSNIFAIAPVTTLDQAVYTVQVINGGGSVISSNASLTVFIAPGPPTITTQPVSLTVTQGQALAFNVGASGPGQLSYQWYFSSVTPVGGANALLIGTTDTALAGATNATLARTNAQPGDAGYYTVVVANIFGSVTGQVAALTVLVPPTITTPPKSLTVIQGQGAVFTVAAGGTAPFTYKWLLGGVAISAATNDVLVLTNVGASAAGNYKAVVSNSAGSVTSAVAVLTVLLPPNIATQPFGQSATVGQNRSFTVTVSGTSPFAYQWSREGKPLPGATNSTLALNNVQTSDAGKYSVVITNLAGIVTSSSAALIVSDPLSLTPPCLGTGIMTATGFAFNVCVPTGYNYLIQSSANTRDWTQIYSNVSRSENFLFTDVASTNQSLCFYRAQVLLPTDSGILEQTTAGGTYERVKSGEKGAQSFRHGTAGQPGYTISRLVLHLSRSTLLPTTNLTFYIGTGKNSGALTRSTVSIPPAAITDTSAGNTFQTYEINFSSPVGPLTAGTTYYLNLECESANSGKIYAEAATGSTYANGTYYKDGSDDSKDLWFQLWGK